jgi:hypothetical protein
VSIVEPLSYVLRAWDLSSELHEPAPAASRDEVAHAEHALGRSLPDTARALYSTTNGGSFLNGNFNLHPLLPDPKDEAALSLTTASGLLRSWEWPVPEDLVVFGDNGAGEQFGLWLPDEEARPLVVEVGQVFDEPGLAIVGDDLGRFLLGWTAYYLSLLGDECDTSGAVDALGLPRELRALDDGCTDEEFFAILRWANPGLSRLPDPYDQGITAEQVRQAAHAAE